jgi:hydrogenase maturation protease
VGIGNAWRSDDAAGLAAARLLRGTVPAGVEVLEREGEPSSLLDAFEGADAVWLVDAVAGSTPGTLHRFDATAGPLPAAAFATSTHHLGLDEAIELARALDRLPPRLVVFGVAGARFDTGDTLTPEAEAGVALAAEAVREEVLACTSGG